MPWTLEYHDETQIVELQITGRATGEELVEAASARIAFGKEKGVDLYIINVRDMTAPRSTTSAIYNIPAQVYSQKGMSRLSSIALIEPLASESKWAVSFFEDLCINRGWRVETFVDRDSAIQWLLDSGR